MWQVDPSYNQREIWSRILFWRNRKQSHLINWISLLRLSLLLRFNQAGLPIWIWQVLQNNCHDVRFYFPSTLWINLTLSTMIFQILLAERINMNRLYLIFHLYPNKSKFWGKKKKILWKIKLKQNNPEKKLIR